MGRQTVWKQVEQLLRGRAGWRLQATTIPGAPPVWCFSEEGDVELTVTVEGNSIQVFEMENERITSLDEPEDLAGWLRAYKAAAFADRPTGERPGRRRRGFLQW
jgi:hypothetical protein